MTRIVARDSAIAEPTQPRVAADERHVGRLDRHVGTGADRHPEVRPGERRGVVDPVADHRDRRGRSACSRCDRSRPCPRAAPRPRRAPAGSRRARATASAVARASPVSSHTSMPARAQVAGPPRPSSGPDRVADRDDARRPRRRSPRRPRVAPSARRPRRGSRERRRRRRRARSSSARLPTSTAPPVDASRRRRGRRSPRTPSTAPEARARARAPRRRSPRRAGAPSPLERGRQVEQLGGVEPGAGSTAVDRRAGPWSACRSCRARPCRRGPRPRAPRRPGRGSRPRRRARSRP